MLTGADTSRSSMAKKRPSIMTSILTVQIMIISAKEHPTDYEIELDNSLNGINRNVDFVDVGCGFGGLLSSDQPF